MADPENLRKKRPSTAPVRSTALRATEVRSQDPSVADQVLNRQQEAGNTAVSKDLLSRSRPSRFTNEDIQESIRADTSSEPSQQASSLVREGQLETRRSPGGKSQPVPLEGGNFTHKYAEPLRQVLPPPEIPERFAPDVEAGNIIPLVELPDGLLAEQAIGSLFRADRVTVVDAENGIIYEIKPDTVTSIRNGQNQVLESVELANQSARDGRRDWRGIVVVYNRKAARRFVAPPSSSLPKPLGSPPSGGGSSEPAEKVSVSSSAQVPAEQAPGSGQVAASAETSPLEAQPYDVRPPAESTPETLVQPARDPAVRTTPETGKGEPRGSILIDPDPASGLGGPSPSRRAAIAGGVAEAGAVILPVLIDSLSRYGANLAEERELAEKAEQIAAARTSTTGVVVVINMRHTLQGDPTAGISTTEFVSLYPVGGFTDLRSGIQALKERSSLFQDVPFSSIETTYLWVPPLPATVPVEPLR